jgi:DNA-binding NarL/FixJ family response regulator
VAAPLATAQSVFRRLRAQPWLDRAETELRACGVDVTPPAGALGELSPQQRQIVYLANLGLTNREIADRLFLSHRTSSTRRDRQLLASPRRHAVPPPTVSSNLKPSPLRSCI